MKKYRKVTSALLALSLTVSLHGCAYTNSVSESSVEEVSVVSKNLTAYELRVLDESVESPLNIACTTLYECVRTGSITKKSAEGKFSFVNQLPPDNASPTEKRQMAEALTLKNAIEYFGLQEIYSDENIREYGYLSVSYNQNHLIKGTVIKIETIKEVSSYYIPFTSTNIQLGDFIDGNLLLSR